MKLGIVGLPNVGKSTLFNAITKAGADSANYPFCTIEPNIGTVAVPDERLQMLTEMYNPDKVVPAVIDFVDIAGLVKGASKGEGLGNKFLSNIREVDAIVHVVRCFDDPNIIHVDGDVNPTRDIETINLELIFSDLEIIDRRIDKTVKQARTGDAGFKKQLEVLTLLKAELEKGNLLTSIELAPIDKEFMDSLFLLTSKPVIYAANISEDMLPDGSASEKTDSLKKIAKKEGSGVIVICSKIEEEISQLDDCEKKEFLLAMGLEKSGLDKLIKESYALLGLISYLTAGKPEVRAWTITKGTKAPQAAGKIHTDFERGFIRAEIIGFKELIECGSIAAAKEKGLVRSEGKEYVMKDGDVTLFRFNV